MARTNDPNSATSQFFLNFVDNSAGKLDPGGFSPEGYAVFGKITKGLEVLDKLEALAGPGDGPPTKQIPSSVLFAKSNRRMFCGRPTKT